MEFQHHSRYPDLSHTGDQLGKKFNDLAKRSIPTGDPFMPQEVREAKRIRLLIYQKSDGGTGSVSEGFGLQLGPDDDAKVASINQQGEQGAVPDDFLAVVWVLDFLLVMWVVTVFKLV